MQPTSTHTVYYNKFSATTQHYQTRGVRDKKGMRTARNVRDNTAGDACGTKVHGPAQATGAWRKQAPSFGGLGWPTPSRNGREQACRLQHLKVLYADGGTRQLKLTRAKKRTPCNTHKRIISSYKDTLGNERRGCTMRCHMNHTRQAPAGHHGRQDGGTRRHEREA